MKRKSILNVMLSLGTCFPVGQGELEDNLACLEWSLAEGVHPGSPFKALPPTFTPVHKTLVWSLVQV